MFNTIKMIDYKKPLRTRLADRKHCGPYQWTPDSRHEGRAFYTAMRGLEMDRHGSTFRLRLEEANEHVIGRTARITGYYCDSDGDCTMTPIIARLPHGRGYLAGWTMGGGMLGAVERDVYDTPEDAALAAHSIAERDAEREREADDLIEEGE